MKSAKVILALCGCGLLAGCGDYAGGEQISAERKESQESPNFGSATDVTPTQGMAGAAQTATNPLNRADSGLGGPLQEQSGNFQSQPLPGQASDEELAKKIKVALTTGSMGTTGAIAEDQLTKIDVRVHNGVAVLSGPVSTEQEKQTIEKQVAGMKGVKGVRNALTVGGREVEDKALESIVPRSPGNE